MGLFDKISNISTSAMMNQIRCDLDDYLVWHWSPDGVDSSARSMAVRFGSSLRVKDGEAAVFVYKQNNGVMQEVIYGPYDGIIETKNFPILANIISKFYDGGTPFQADVYFINLSSVVQMSIGIPYTDTSDPRFPDFIVPVSAGGKMSFRIADIEKFIRAHRLIGFSIEQLQNQVRELVEKVGKSAVSSAPYKYNIPLTQIERMIDVISDEMKVRLGSEMSDFGVEMVRWDLNRISPDKSSPDWAALINITRGRQEQVLQTQTAMEVKNLKDMQAINAENLQESLRVQREELQRAQRLQSESSYISAHAINRQADVLEAAAQNLGTMTSMGGGGEGSGMNVAGMMSGMYMGGAIGSQFGQMMGQMNQYMTPGANPPGASATPPPLPGTPPAPPVQLAVWVLINGQQAGPFDFGQLQQLAASGSLLPATLVWRQGMPQWMAASNVPVVAAVFNAGVNAVPPPPPSNIP